jgi:hypothetical protein
MVIRDLKIFLAQLVLMIGVTACAGHGANQKPATEMPSGWAVSVQDKPDVCTPIDDEFVVEGLSYRGQDSELVQSRLDADLGYPYPASSKPNRVKVSTHNSAKKLTILFGAPVNKSVSVFVNCEDGWWKFVQNASNEYTGDGGKIDELTSIILLAKSPDGGLIVHVSADVVDSSLVILKVREYGESWSKYEAATNPG